MLGIIFLLCLKFYISAAVSGAYGLTASFNCEYTVNRGYDYFWQKKGTSGGTYKYLTSNQNKYVFAKTLVILNLNFADSGSYRCVLPSPRASGQDQELNVTRKPVLTTSHSTQYTRIGDSAFLDVTVMSLEPITDSYWVQRSQIVNSNKYAINKYNLTIRSVNTNDDGVYTFYAVNYYGTQSITITLITGNVPYATTTNQQKYAKRGESVLLDVTVQSSTSSYWKKGIQQLSTNSKYTFEGHNLRVNYVQQADDGEYTFNAANSFGQISLHFQLTSGYVPYATTTNPQKYAKRGEGVLLDVTVQSSTSSYWKKGIRQLYTNSKYTFEGHNLRINNVQLADDGGYTFYATNEFGQTPLYIQLTSGYKPSITTINNRISAKIFTQTVLHISVPQATPIINKISWYKNNKYLDLYGFNKYSDGIIGKPSLVLTSVAEDDDGIYKCEVSNGVDTSFVEIYLSTWSDINVSLSGSRNVAIGETATIIGSITSKPNINKVIWKKGVGHSAVDVDVNHNSKYEIVGSLTNPQLKIKNIQESDKGTYTCVAKHLYATGSGTIDINVGVRPEATIPENHYVSKFGYSITLQCIVKNDSSNIVVYWLKGKSDVRSLQSSRYSGGNLLKPSLTIKNTNLNDAGVYTCKLDTSYGPSEDSVLLKVLSADVNGPLTLTQRANASVVLLCAAVGGKTVTWRRNGQEVITQNSSVYSGGTQAIPSLHISKVTRYHTGNYTCETSYDSVTATSSSLIQLYVQDIPLVYPISSQIQALTGTNVQITCNHESYQKPSSVFWNKDGENLNVPNSKYNGSTVDVPSLVIFNTRKTDSGKYMCGVVNDIGTGYSKEVMVIIKDPEQASGDVAPVVGGVIGGILALVVVFILVIWLKRRRNMGQKEESRSKVNKEGNGAEKAVHYKQDNKDKGKMYINIGSMSSTDTDEDETRSAILKKPNSNLFVKPNSNPLTKLNSTKEKKAYITTEMKQKPEKDPSLNHENDDSTYYNIESIITSIKVNELKEYIFKKQLKEDFEEEYKKIPYGAQHPVTKAQQKENIPKNRFKSTFPYDHSRVVLEPGHGMSSDYINANYVDGFKTKKCYIASQGPVKQTINDHWRMIWQNNTRKIIMLTNLDEGPRRKCERYWPEGGKPMTCGNLVLTLLTEKERAAYITREIELKEKKTNEKRCIIQYHFTAWPDHGTPDPLYLVLFHKHVITDHTSTENNGPILVHCSAGIGRTGTYIGLDALYEEGRDTGFVDVLNFVKKMRNSRMNMVQTAGQYVCLHSALLEALTMNDTNVEKEQFGTIWQKIVSDKSPVNRQRLHEEFKMLESKKLEHDKAQYVAAKSPENVKKNRNKIIIPTDNNRLFLTSYEKGRTDYINAVQAPSYTKFIGYLTTQLPLPDTKVDFWTMVRDHNSSTIVVFLNDPAEAELVYSTSKDSFTCGKYNLTISNRGKEDMDITSCKVVLSKKDDKPRDIALYLAVSKGLPDPQVLCKLVTLISTRVSMSNDPVTVVSGDGAKNCGVFCTFANAVSSMTIDNNANIFQLARLLQLRRPEFFSDFNEYRLCYEALNLYLESSSVYANF